MNAATAGSDVVHDDCGFTALAMADRLDVLLPMSSPRVAIRAGLEDSPNSTHLSRDTRRSTEDS